MATLLGKYLNNLGVIKEKVRLSANITKSRMNDLNNKETAKITAEEFYRIIISAIKIANKVEAVEFNIAVDYIFPNRIKCNFIDDFKQLKPEIRFFKSHMLSQKHVESKIGMPSNKISMLTTEKNKEVLAIELIQFIEGLKKDMLKTFKEIFKDIEIN